MDVTMGNISGANEFLHYFIRKYVYTKIVCSAVPQVWTIQIRSIRGALHPVQVVPKISVSCTSLGYMKHEVFRTYSHSSLQIQGDPTRPGRVGATIPLVGSRSKQNFMLYLSNLRLRVRTFRVLKLASYYFFIPVRGDPPGGISARNKAASAEIV